MNESTRPDSARHHTPSWLACWLLRHGQTILPRVAAWRRWLDEQPRPWRRRLQRRLAVGLGGAALLLALAGAGAQGDPAAPGSAIAVAAGQVAVADDGLCSLVEAILNANDTATGLVHADCATGDPLGADTIILPSDSTFTLTTAYAPSEEFLDTGLPWLTGPVTIEGEGATILRAPDAPPFRIMAVAEGAQVALNNAVITGGRLDMAADGWPGRHTSANGGGILNLGQLSIVDSRILNNRAIGQNSAAGGGIANEGTLTLTRSIVSGNQASIHNTYRGYSANGGGIFSDFGSVLTIHESEIRDNTGEGVKGTHDSVVTIYDSVIANNDGSSGGGVSAMGSLTLVRSEVVNNLAHAWGGGVMARNLRMEDSRVAGNVLRNQYVAGAGVMVFDGTIERSAIVDNKCGDHGCWGYGYNGGGVIVSGQVTISNSTITGNGDFGVENRGTLRIENSTITDNRFGGLLATCNYDEEPSTTVIRRSILSGNDRPELQLEPGWECLPVVELDATNILGYNGDARLDGVTPGASDIVPAVALDGILLPLVSDDPTGTHALPPHSPAIDAAPSAACAAPPIDGLDQRRAPRNQDGNGLPGDTECDIGAYEAPANTTPTEQLLLPIIARSP